MKRRVAAIVGLLLCLLLLPVGVAWWSSDLQPSPPHGTEPETPVLTTAPTEPAQTGVPEPAVAASDPAPEIPFLEGVVRSFDRQEPIPGAHVELRDNSLFGVSVATTESDSTGRFVFARPSRFGRNYDVVASASGFVAQSQRATFLDNNPLRFEVPELRLRPGVRVAGRVVKPDGASISFGEVCLTHGVSPGFFADRKSYFFIGQSTIRVDPDGRFEGFAFGEHLIVGAQVSDCEPVWVGPFHATDPTLQSLVIELEPGSNVTGFVVDDDGKPIADAVILQRTVLFETIDWDPRPARTDSTGYFELGGFAHHEVVTLEVTAPGCGWLRTEVGTRASAELVLERRSRPAELRLRLEDGRPVVGVPAFVKRMDDGFSVFEYHEGSHRSDDFPRSEGNSWLVAPGYAKADFEWTSHHSGNLGELVVTPLSVFTLQIVDESGAPIPGVSVRTASMSPHPSLGGSYEEKVLFSGCTATPRTDGTGVVELVGLRVGRHMLRIERPGHPRFEHEVEVNEGTSSLGDCALPVAPSVRFHLAGDRSDARALVSLNFDRAGEAFELFYDFNRVGHPDENGVVLLERLPVGATLDLSVTAPGAIPIETLIDPLEPGEIRDLGFISLRTGTSLDVRVVDIHGAPILSSAIQLWLERADHAAYADRELSVTGVILNPTGWRRFDGLIAGAYVVKGWAHGYEHRSITATTTQARAEITLEPTRTHAICVSFDNGDPVAGATLSFDHPEWLFVRDPEITDVNGCALLPTSNLDQRATLAVHWGVHRSKQLISIKRDVAAGAEPTEITIPRGADLLVRLAFDDGRPFTDSADITIQSTADADPVTLPYSSQNCFACGAGTLLFEGVAPGWLELTIDPAGHDIVKTRAAARSGRVTEVDIVVGP